MEKIVINVRNAFLSGGFVRLPTEDGSESIYVMEGAFYEAQGSDTLGNEYRIYWNIKDDYDDACGDEADACDWENPAAVVVEEGGEGISKLVSAPVELVF